MGPFEHGGNGIFWALGDFSNNLSSDNIDTDWRLHHLNKISFNWGLIDYALVFQICYGWVYIQFKITNQTKLYIRIHYSDNPWSDWKAIY